jgi:putative membrane protein
MVDMSTDTRPAQVRNRRVHMANERTFLAWIRTSVAIMAFGFVVEKFSLFVKQMAYYLGKETVPPPQGYSSMIGIILVGLGVVMSVLAFIRYKKVERQIDEDSYQPSAILSVLLAISIIAVGFFLVLYLVHSI